MKVHTNPLVSVVIACYNDKLYIEEAIQSVLSQSYKNIEILVVDDGSDAETKAVLKSLEPKINSIITQENLGQSTARNNGIREAKGAYILVLDSDDYFEPSFIERALSSVKDSVRLITCWANCFTEKEATQYIPKGGDLENFLFENASIGNALFRKIDWKACGGYDEQMREGWEDWEFFIRLMALGGSCHVIPEVLFNYRLRENSTTSRANQKQATLLSYILKKNSVFYKSKFNETIDFLIENIEHEQRERSKVFTKPEYKVGKAVIDPIRALKRKLKKK